jgi:hypothetical protein
MRLTLRTTCILVAALFIAGCAAPQAASTPVPPATPSSQTTSATVAPAATAFAAGPTPTADRWAELFERTPFPYTTPLPEPMASALDGIYVKVEQIEGTPTPCRRCPDYKIEGGVWRLSFDNGIFRVYHTVTGWRTLGSYTVEGDRLLLFNDPTCLREVGSYRYALENGSLRLETVEDTCAIRLRSRNLSNIAWSACTPPNEEAAVTDHWKKPAGCG